MSKEWQKHYQAMKRWKERALSVSIGIVPNAEDGWVVDGTEVDDLARAYFIWAHSMRDWLIDSAKIEKSTLDAVLCDRDEWKNVRDFANKSKHASITRPSKDPHWKSGMKIDLNAMIAGTGGSEPYISIGGRTMKLDESITEIDLMWDEVIAQLNLDVSTP